MSTSPLLMMEGVFHDAGEGIAVYPEDGSSTLVRSALSLYEGEKVHLALHHCPPNPPILSPGGGSCLWAGHCPCGHLKDPAWLYSLSVEGVLSQPSPGEWKVGDTAIPFGTYLLGHRGRMILLRGSQLPEDGKGLGKLVSEAESLLGVLAELRGVLK